MIVPILIAWFGNETDLFGFIIAGTLCIVIGIPVWLFTRKYRRLTIKDGFAVVTFAWIITALVGSLPFYFSGLIPSFTDAFFEAMSGVTTTGATIIGSTQTMPHLENGIESLPHATLYWRSFIQWIGGMGIIVFYIAILPLLGVGGVQLFKAEVPGPVADKIRPRVRETAKILWLVYVGISLAEAIMLMFAGMSLFDAVCHTFTTMPTGGFSTRNASIGAFDSSVIHYIIIFFMFLAGVNFSLHFRALSGNLKSYFRDKEFLYYLGIIMGVTFLIFISVCLKSDSWDHINFRDSLFQTVSIITTTGYGTADYELWAYFAQLLLLGMMFVGAMGGSTGGGMKVVRIILIIKYILLETRRMLHIHAILPVRIGRRTISEDVIRNTLGFFLFYVMIFGASAVALTALGWDIESSIGAAASALGNIGPALGEFGPTDNYALLHPIGKWLLSFCMLLGRLEIFTVMVIFSRTFWRT
ncbi:MAG: TrkH family potassium uptake protein [Candidatus Marinimicrobia bacterium]|nr:TrkH family potassium uptake protein [Candidatus Neomarinimicrobiota bacterium]